MNIPDKNNDEEKEEKVSGNEAIQSISAENKPIQPRTNTQQPPNPNDPPQTNIQQQPNLNDQLQTNIQQPASNLNNKHLQLNDISPVPPADEFPTQQILNNELTNNISITPINLLITILTNNNIDYLKRAVNSIKNQYKCDKGDHLDYEIKIIVNSCNKYYFDEVLKEYPTIDVIDSISNSYPGKGHNMCLEVFKRHEKFNYLTILDGDDVLYPVAFQRFCSYIKQFNFDILHLMINDTVKLYNRNSDTNAQSYTILLKDNFHLFSTFDNFDNHWANFAITVENPYTSTSLLNIKTPSRIALTNRNIFKTNIQYDEKLKVHDDLIAFCHLYESQLNHIINSIVVADSYIYVYNALNNESVSKQAFKTKESLDNELNQLQQILCNKRFKHVQKWRLDLLPFVIINPPTNYSTHQKIDFCNKEIVQFEVKQTQKHIQQYFRTYCKNKETMTTQNAEIIKNKIIDALSLYYFSYGITERNALQSCYNISLQLGVKNFAYIILKSLYEKYPFVSYLEELFKIGYELQKYDHCQFYYSLLKRYNHLLQPTENNNYNTVQDHNNNTNLPNKTDHNNNNNNTSLSSFSSINDVYEAMCGNIRKAKFKNIIDNSKPIICMHTGYLNVDYNGDNYQQKPVYGNEIITVQLCEQLSTKFNVIVLSTGIEKFNKCKGVIYANVNDFNVFNRHFTIDHFVICRFIGCVLDVDLSKINNIYFVMHDSIPNYLWKYHQNYLPNKALQIFQNFEKRIKRIICVSKWQRNNLLMYMNNDNNNNNDKNYNMNNGKNNNKNDNDNEKNDDDNIRNNHNEMVNDHNKNYTKSTKITIIPNAIYITTTSKINKKSNRFIYCSSPQRGLQELCEVLSQLNKYIADIVLDVYYGINKEIITQYNKYKFVKFHGKISQNQLRNELLTTDFWIYPINDKHTESFCLTCLEAMAAKNVIIVSNNSAINELICGDNDNNNNNNNNHSNSKCENNNNATTMNDTNHTVNNVITMNDTNHSVNIGILIPKFNDNKDKINFIVDQIIKINGSNKLKKQYQENAFRRAKQYDWEIIKHKWIDVFSEYYQ